ncbi:hypothetical protein RLOC_00004149 [Lonchura striata]|uniref:Uncharacterized protein n=1 Tax=Lonchura striata TaxID=40157 RepID=A0A218UI66_9PASE|nr:hypothetical protein RLOC_00004149 [Lonchura striata domestica]
MPQNNTATLLWWRECLRVTHPPCVSGGEHVKQPRGFGDPPAASLTVPAALALEPLQTAEPRQHEAFPAISSINFLLVCLVAMAGRVLI